tara:strand:- start:1267 stop:1620 length:354 start_codon:yes stop_codon:yes gene_type:complete
VIIDGERETRTFESKEDVWDVVNLIVEETKDFNEQEGKDFEIADSVLSQIPFFACPNIFFSRQIKQDIEKYLYCEKFGVPPYSGSYGDQPYQWVNRSFLIKSAIAKREKKDIDGKRK